MYVTSIRIEYVQNYKKPLVHGIESVVYAVVAIAHIWTVQLSPHEVIIALSELP